MAWDCEKGRRDGWSEWTDDKAVLYHSNTGIMSLNPSLVHRPDLNNKKSTVEENDRLKREIKICLVWKGQGKTEIFWHTKIRLKGKS